LNHRFFGDFDSAQQEQFVSIAAEFASRLTANPAGMQLKPQAVPGRDVNVNSPDATKAQLNPITQLEQHAPKRHKYPQSSLACEGFLSAGDGRNVD
jgi:hypothetical protein